MADTKIEWARNPDGSKGKSWNALRARRKDGGKVGWYCQKKSPGCQNCYAERMNLRVSDEGEGIGNGVTYTVPSLAFVEPFLDMETLLEPLRWKKPRTVFVCSQTDLFGSWVKDEWIDRVYAIEALCPQDTFIHVTKRPERRLEYLSAKDVVRRICTAAYAFHQSQRTLTDTDEFSAANTRRFNAKMKRWWEHVGKLTAWTVETGIAADSFRTHEPNRGYPSWVNWPLPNVREMVTVCNQDEADRDIPILLQTPAACRGVSIEPMLGPIDIRQWLGIECRHEGAYVEPDTNDLICRQCEESACLDWVICGGESGPGARPVHPDWGRSLRDQCKAAGVPFFFKQWGEWLPGTQYEQVHRDADPGLEGSRFACMDWDGEKYFDSPGQWMDEVDDAAVFRVGKKLAGSLLDGVEHKEFPR